MFQISLYVPGIFFKFILSLKLYFIVFQSLMNFSVYFGFQIEKSKAFKCGTFGASSLQQRYMATGDFDGKMQIW